MDRNKKAILVLNNGLVFNGFALGHIGETIGEVCFNTGMTGYQEILTDPSYCDQIVTMTYPHIGNYGISPDDVESSKIQVSGFIVKEATEIPSNYRSTQSIESYMTEQKIVGIQGIDTRMLTRVIRDEGAQNALISSKCFDAEVLLKKVNAYPSMEGKDLAKKVTCTKAYRWNPSKLNNKPYKVAAIDYGIKFNILRQLSEYANVRVFPANVTESEILNYSPDGIFLSNGPGDPEAVDYAIKTIKKLMTHNIPIFGICLGHQLVCHALGGKTFKLKFGHRGCNHPVKNLNTNIVEITSQNHGFAVDQSSLPDNVEITHISLNDNTVEGMQCKNLPIFSVQYHPESSPGPHDSKYLFEQFMNLIKHYNEEENLVA